MCPFYFVEGKNYQKIHLCILEFQNARSLVIYVGRSLGLIWTMEIKVL